MALSAGGGCGRLRHARAPPLGVARPGRGWVRRRATEPTLSQVTPPSAYNDAPVTLACWAARFRPRVGASTPVGRHARVEPGAVPAVLVPRRRATAELRRALDGLELDRAQQPRRPTASCRPGTLRRDLVAMCGAPRQQVSRQLRFTSLGPDLEPPRRHLPPAGRAQPSSAGPDGAVVEVQIDDGAGHAEDVRRVTVSGGPASPRALPRATRTVRATCTFTFTAPTPDAAREEIDIRLDAEDSIPNAVGRLSRPSTSPRPFVTAVSRHGRRDGRRHADRRQRPRLRPGVTEVSSTGRRSYRSTGTSVVSTIQGIALAHMPGAFQLAVRTGDSVERGAALLVRAPACSIVKLVDRRRTAGHAAYTDRRVAGDNFRAETQFFWHPGRRALCAPRGSPTPIASRPAAARVPGRERFRADLYLPAATGTISRVATRRCGRRSRSSPTCSPSTGGPPHEAAVQAHAPVARRFGRAAGHRRLLVAAHRPAAPCAAPSRRTSLRSPSRSPTTSAASSATCSSILRVDARIFDLDPRRATTSPTAQGLLKFLQLVYHQSDDFCAVALFDEHGAAIGSPAYMENPGALQQLPQPRADAPHRRRGGRA